MTHQIPNEDITWLKSKIHNIEPLSIDEEKELFHLISQGNKKAKDKLVEANMKFVISVAKEYSYAHLSTSDLVAEGTIGLIRAIQSFDYTRGLKFITYAVWWIRAYITRAVNEQGNLVRLPANQNLKLRQSLRNNREGNPLTEEIQKLLQLTDGNVSLDKSILNENSTQLSEILSDPSEETAQASHEKENLNLFLKKLFKKLPSRESDVLRRLYGTSGEKDVSQNIREISESMGLSRERIRQLRDQGIKRITQLNDDGHYNTEINAFYALADKPEKIL